MKVVVENKGSEPYVCIVEPWGSAIEVLPNQKFYIIGSGNYYFDCPEFQMHNATPTFYIFCERVGIYDLEGNLLQDISGHSPATVKLNGRSNRSGR